MYRAETAVGGERPSPPGGLATWRRNGVQADGHREHPGKRPLDVFLSGLGLLVSAPIFLTVALAVKLEDGGPVFYTQERVGRGQRPFRLVKFRSMIVDAEAKTGPVWAGADDPRITRVGRLLRRTACDELPQLVNIFRGDMSFVGPRAHRRAFYDQFARQTPGYDRRYAIRPGLTGLAQLFARYDSPALQKLRFDLLYMKRASLPLDLKLIFASFLVTFLGRWDERRGKKLGILHRIVVAGGRRAGRAARRGR
jgi:lipopolysaccharide/colanic/teichoic acid biosynthesis glycosyltransferase